MEKVYVTGHRNPDLDSICSAYAYAKLKNITDPSYEYVGVRCGHLSANVKEQLASVGIEAVPYMRNVYPKAGDVANRNAEPIDSNAPIFSLVATYDTTKPSAMPVFADGKCCGLLCVDDITNWFLKDNARTEPRYNIRLENIAKVLPGKFIKKGADISNAAILVGAAAIDEFDNFISTDLNSVVVLGYRKEHIKLAIKKQVSAVIITTTENIESIDFNGYKGTVFATKTGTAEAVRRLRMAVSIKDIMGSEDVRIPSDTVFEDAREVLTKSHQRGISIVEEGEWIGFVTRRCFLKKPSYNVILVDHNEKAQSIRGIETATVKEIIDHHRLDALKTDLPIFIDSEPLGSTCTIVYQQYKRHGIVPDAYTAKVLLTGIISDTQILKSPTTTQVDEQTVAELSKLAGIDDFRLYGEKLFSCSQSLAYTNPEDAISSDFKQYSEKGMKFGIGQCETTTLTNLSEYAEAYLQTLEEIKKKSGLDWAMLMITNVLEEHSILLVTDNRLNKKLPFTEASNLVYDMPGVMSRKKQLLPEIIHTID